MADGLGKAQVGADPSLTAFLPRVRAVLTAQGVDLARRLADVAGFFDRMASAHPGRAFLPLHDAADAGRRLIAAAAPASLALDQPGVPHANARRIGAPVPRPLIISTGVVLDGQRGSVPEVMEPDPAIPESGRIAWGLLEDGWTALRHSFRQGLAADLTAAATALLQDWNCDGHRVRGLLNLVTRHTERCDGPGVLACLNHLRGLGWRPLLVPVGQVWDPDRHDPLRHDRVVRSDGPGLVVGIRQVGLLGQDGLPLQKCIVVTE